MDQAKPKMPSIERLNSLDDLPNNLQLPVPESTENSQSDFTGSDSDLESESLTSIEDSSKDSDIESEILFLSERNSRKKSSNAEGGQGRPNLYNPQKSLENFRLLKIIAITQRSIVLLGEQKLSKQFYAIKLISPETKLDYYEFDTVSKKVNDFVCSDMMIESYEKFEWHGYSCSVVEFMSGGDLGQLVQSRGRLSDSHVRFYMAEILTVLEEFRYLKIVHKNLRMENILIDKRGHIRIADFGLNDDVMARRRYEQFLSSFKEKSFIKNKPEIVKQFFPHEHPDSEATGGLCFQFDYSKRESEGPARRAARIKSFASLSPIKSPRKPMGGILAGGILPPLGWEFLKISKFQINIGEDNREELNQK
jgi:hypothetical protein